MTFQVRLDALTTELWVTRGERGRITGFICDRGLLTAKLNGVKCDKCKYDKWSDDWLK